MENQETRKAEVKLSGLKIIKIIFFWALNSVTQKSDQWIRRKMRKIEKIGNL